MSAQIVLNLVDHSSKNLKIVSGNLLKSGKPVWLYTIDDYLPKKQVTDVVVFVNGKKSKLPRSLLMGLYDVGGSGPSFPGGIWLNDDKKTWHIYFSCADGGRAFQVYMSGKFGGSVVQRVDYRDGVKVGRFVSRIESQ